MPHFSSCCKGHDTYICQICAKIYCSGCKPSSSRPDLTGNKSAGNVCPRCLDRLTTDLPKFFVKEEAIRINP